MARSVLNSNVFTPNFKVGYHTRGSNNQASQVPEVLFDSVFHFLSILLWLFFLPEKFGNMVVANQIDQNKPGSEINKVSYFNVPSS